MRTSAIGMGELLSASWGLSGISRRRSIEGALGREEAVLECARWECVRGD